MLPKVGVLYALRITRIIARIALFLTRCPRDTAKALLETAEVRDDLPAIAGLSG